MTKEIESNPDVPTAETQTKANSLMNRLRSLGAGSISAAYQRFLGENFENMLDGVEEGIISAETFFKRVELIFTEIEVKHGHDTFRLVREDIRDSFILDKVEEGSTHPEIIQRILGKFGIRSAYEHVSGMLYEATTVIREKRVLIASIPYLVTLNDKEFNQDDAFEIPSADGTVITYRWMLVDTQIVKD